MPVTVVKVFNGQDDRPRSADTPVTSLLDAKIVPCKSGVRLGMKVEEVSVEKMSRSLAVLLRSTTIAPVAVRIQGSTGYKREVL